MRLVVAGFALAMIASLVPLASAVDTESFCYADVTLGANIPVRSRCDVGPYKEIGTCMRHHCEGQTLARCYVHFEELNGAPDEAWCQPGQILS